MAMMSEAPSAKPEDAAENMENLRE